MKLIKNSKRLSEILFAFAKNGFSSWIKQTKLYDYADSARKFFTKKETGKTPPAQRFRKVFEELGPTFVKLGQILSTRNDLLPEDWIREFVKLQDSVPAAPIAEVEKHLEKELGRPLGEIFSRFDSKPFAAASIAQVYSAEMTDGTPVVVKVQRPGVEETVETDLDIIKQLAELADRHIEVAHDFNITGIVREFSRSLRRELDYTIEERNLTRFRENFKNNDKIHIPKVFSELTTKRCLVIEKISGTKVQDFEADLETRREIARTGTRAMLKQIFEDGHYHADPHPGNIFILEGNVIAFIDFGMVGRADRQTQKVLAKMLTAIDSQDAERLARLLVNIGSPADEVNLRELTLDLADIIEQYYGKTLRSVSLGDVITDVFVVIRRHRLNTPAEYTMILKAILTLEKVAFKLDPDFDFTEEIKPFAVKMFLRKFSPKENVERLGRMLEEAGDFLHEVPSITQGVLRKLHEGRLTFEIRHKQLDQLTEELSRASARLSSAVIILALAVASSAMITLGKTGVLKWAGTIGFIIAGLIGTVLLVNSLFRRRF